MKWIAIFLAGALTGALALGFLVMSWDDQVSVVPSAPAQSGPVQDAVVAAPADAPRLDIPSSGPAQADAPLPSAAMPDVVTVAPSAPVLGDVPADATVPGVAPTLEPAPAPVVPSLVVPVAGITPAQLSDTFTDARGEGRSHDAIDIMAPTGTPVLAVADGRIVKLFNSKQGGLTVYQFDAKDELAFYYAHLDSYAEGLAEGQLVKQGDVIGEVGFTGNASPEGPHLHFAIFVLGPEKNWWRGTAINPYPHLRGP